MEPESRRQILLAGLVVVLAFVLYSAWPFTSAPPASSSGAGSSASPPGAGRGAQNGPRTAGGPEAPDVRLSALSAERPKPGNTERNLFRFRSRARAAGPATTPVFAGGRSGAVVGPPPPTGPPPIALRFIGIVERREKAERIAVLRDAVGHIFYGGEGEVVEGRYRIVRIGAESIELSYLDGQGRQTIRLTGS
jgi:hypothetical protein